MTLTMVRKSMRLEWRQAQKRLEDRGFTPEEIAVAKAQYTEIKELADKAYERYQALEAQAEEERIAAILKAEEKRIADILERIAVNKIKRSKIFNLGLGLKLSMRDCGMY